MPTIALLTSPSSPDAWHQVSAPGGYEYWYFDAEDSDHDRQIVATIWRGFMFDPAYLRAFARYRRRPTRVAPPAPRLFTGAYFAIYERGRVLAQFINQYPADDFRSSSDRPDVVLGSNQFHVIDGRGSNIRMRGRPWIPSWRGPKKLTSHTVAGEFSFNPRLQCEPLDCVFPSRPLTGADHHWMIANPLCEVRGVIELFDANAGRPNVIEFSGNGYHDHCYGTGPIGTGLSSWARGRVLLNDRAFAFQIARPRDATRPVESLLIESSDSGIGHIDVSELKIDWTHRTRMMLRYPNHLKFDDVIELTNPRLIDSSPCHLRLTYEASCRGQRGMALCGITHPNRPGWPILGRLIEMAIHRS